METSGIQVRFRFHPVALYCDCADSHSNSPTWLFFFSFLRLQLSYRYLRPGESRGRG